MITITIGWWLLPTFLTCVMLGFFLKTWLSPQMDYWGLDLVFSILWLVPISLVWVLYFGIRLMVETR